MSQSQSSDHSYSGPPAFERRDRIAVLAIILLAVGLGVLAGIFNPLLRGSSGAEGRRVDALFSLLLGIGTTVFVIVQGGVLYSVFRFGYHGDPNSDADEDQGLPFRGHLGLEVLWSAIPAGIVTGLAIYSFIVLTDIEVPRDNSLTVEVTGRQFQWEFYYPALDVTSQQLHVPVGRQVYLKMRSADVIHSFWVPELRIKKDVNPDRVTETWITPQRAGTFPIVCAELCGAGHAAMRSDIVVEEAGAFEVFWSNARKTAQIDKSDPIAWGRALFTQYGCNACHALADARATGAIGPKLDGIGGRAASAVPGMSVTDYLRSSIVQPNQHIAQGFQPNVMPQDYGQRMQPDEIDAMVKYLESQK